MNIKKKFKDIWEDPIYKIITILLVGVTIVGIPYYSFAGNKNTTKYESKSNKEYKEHELIALTKHVVSNKLKSPSTAKFCKTSEFRITDNGKDVYVRGYVDAQNGFGATVRRNFTAIYDISGKYIRDVYFSEK